MFTSLRTPDWSTVSGSGEDAVIDLSNIIQIVLMRSQDGWLRLGKKKNFNS